MFLPLFFIQILFGCGEEVDTGPQFKIDPVNLPIEIEKIGIIININDKVSIINPRIKRIFI